MSNLLLTVASFATSILLFVIFFSKKPANNKETKIYSTLLKINLVYCIVDFAVIMLIGYIQKEIFMEIAFKLHMAITAILLILLYVYGVTVLDFSEKAKKSMNITSAISAVLIAVAILATPLKVDATNDLIKLNGLAYNISMISTLVYIFFIIVYIARIYIKTKDESAKATPFVILVICYSIGLLTRNYVSLNLLENYLFTFTLLVMYFTIENPDSKVAAELEIAKKEAEKANEAKTEFLTKMSHEVRTPLNAIVGFAATLEEVETLEEARENSQYIVQASKNILELVNGILDISKIEENKVEVVNTEYSLTKELEEVIRFVEPRLTGKPIVFKKTIARDLPKVLVGDKSKLKEIITNLLNNAVEYTKEGYIELSVSCINKEETSSLVISVEDSGTGISQKNVEKLFDKYSTFDDSLNKTSDASGLELAITKKLVELLGGRIIVQTAQGAGTKFTIYLNQEIGKETSQIEEPEVESVTEEVDENQTLNLKGKKILVVDDNNLNLKVAVNFIKEYGAEIDTCTSGNECVSRIKEGAVYDIIFMDDMMPKVSGTETLHILQQIPDFNQTVIVLTANSIEGVRDKYLEAGFKDYLSKPIIKLELERILRKYLNNCAQRVVFDPVPSSITNMDENK